MAEKEEKVVEATAEVSTKTKRRRGITNEVKAVSQLKFHEKDSQPQTGLFIGQLAEVKVEWSVNAEGKAFTGLKCPRLTFHFTSNHANNDEKRHVYFTCFPVESNVNTIPGGSEEWKYNNVINAIKHILDVIYLKGRKLTEEEENLLALPLDDVDDEGNYVVVDPEDVLKAYATLFTNVANMLNGIGDGDTPKPCYKDANGNPIPLYMKLLRHKRAKDGWRNVGNNGELAFDTFVGTGFIEIKKGNEFPRILSVDPAKESITPKVTNKDKKEPNFGKIDDASAMVGTFPTMPAGVNPVFEDGTLPF